MSKPAAYIDNVNLTFCDQQMQSIHQQGREIDVVTSLRGLSSCFEWSTSFVLITQGHNSLGDARHTSCHVVRTLYRYLPLVHILSRIRVSDFLAFENI